MPKNVYVFIKSWKIAAASGALPPNPHWLLAAGGSDPWVVTPAYYHSFIMAFLGLKKQYQQTANALLLLLPCFFTYFLFQTLQFLLMGAQKYFFGTGYPSYATELAILTLAKCLHILHFHVHFWLSHILVCPS